MIRQETYIGKVLLAEPFLLDTNFKRAAVLICDHTRGEGSVGYILNKPLDMKVDELIVDFPEFNAEVYFGGPVQTDTIHYLHNMGETLEGSTKVAPGVFWGGDFEKLKNLIHLGRVQPKNIRFFVGYSGWSEGQLDDEMNVGTWLMSEMHANYLFKTEPEIMWQQILEHKGDIYTVIAQMPDTANWN